MSHEAKATRKKGFNQMSKQIDLSEELEHAVFRLEQYLTSNHLSADGSSVFFTFPKDRSDENSPTYIIEMKLVSKEAFDALCQPK